jgi:hypothetical protein
MATYVTLCELKARVYADDTTAYDCRLQSILDHAEHAIIAMTDHDYEDVIRITPEFFPGELKEAIIQLAAAWFAQPEGTAPTQFHAVPFGINFLVKPYQKMSGGDRLTPIIERCRQFYGDTQQ